MNQNASREGWLMGSYTLLFQALKGLSLFQLFRWAVSALLGTVGVKLGSKWDSGVVDLWVFANLVAAAAFTFAATSYETWNVISAVGAAYGCYRLFEILVVQINVLVFDPYRENLDYKAGRRDHPYVLRGRYRSVVLFAHNYAEIAFWFTAAYLVLQHQGLATISGIADRSQVDIPSLYARSLIRLAEFAGDPISVGTGKVVGTLTTAHSLIGALATLVLLARVVSLLPSPPTLSELNEHSGEGTPPRSPR